MIRSASSVATRYLLIIVGSLGLNTGMLQAGERPPSIAPKATSVAEPETTGGAPTMRLIDGQQYDNAIADVFGADIQINNRFPPTRRTEGLVALGASTAALTSGALEVFDSAGREIAAKVID